MGRDISSDAAGGRLPAPDTEGPGRASVPELDAPAPTMELAFGRLAIDGRAGAVAVSQIEKATERPVGAHTPRALSGRRLARAGATARGEGRNGRDWGGEERNGRDWGACAATA